MTHRRPGSRRGGFFRIRLTPKDAKSALPQPAERLHYF